MHIGFICNEYPPRPHGGIGTWTQAMARRLVADGHRTTVIGTYGSAGGEGGVEDDRGVRVIRVTTASRVVGIRAVIEQRKLWRRLAEVHAADPLDAVEGAEASLWAAPRRTDYPTIVRMHGGHRFFAEAEGRATAPARSWMEARSVRRADDLVAVSAYVAARTRHLLGLGDRPVTVIPNPVDVAEFKPSADSSGESSGRVGTVLFIGTVCEKKGVRQLVEGFSDVVARVPAARLVVAGRDQIDRATGTSFTDLLRASIPHDLIDRIDFVGPVDHDDVGALITGADVCAMPSHMEANPLVWLEVMASGRALVASTAGPGPEIIEDGVSGVLVDPHDPDAISNAIVTLLTDADLRARVAEGGRARVVERFSLDELAAVNVEHYRAVAERWAAARG